MITSLVVCFIVFENIIIIIIIEIGIRDAIVIKCTAKEPRQLIYRRLSEVWG